MGTSALFGNKPNIKNKSNITYTRCISHCGYWLRRDIQIDGCDTRLENSTANSLSAVGDEHLCGSNFQGFLLSSKKIKSVKIIDGFPTEGLMNVLFEKCWRGFFYWS